MNKKIICVSIYSIDEYGTTCTQKILKADSFDDVERDELWDEYAFDPVDMEEISLSELEDLLME